MTTQPRASAAALAGMQRSTPEHQEPSSHAASLGVWLAVPVLQLSTVHATPSSGTSVMSTS